MLFLSMVIEQKKNDIFLIKHNFFYKNEKTHFRKLLTKIFAFKHGIYNGRQFQEQFIISKRNLHTCPAIEGRCSLVVVVVVVVVDVDVDVVARRCCVMFGECEILLSM